MSKRIVFTFDQRSFDALESLRRDGNFESLADAVRESIRITRALQQQGKQGFTDVLVRNPVTGDENVMVMPPII